MPHRALLLPEGPGVDGAARAGVVVEGVLATVRLKQEEGVSGYHWNDKLNYL